MMSTLKVKTVVVKTIADERAGQMDAAAGLAASAVILLAPRQVA